MRYTLWAHQLVNLCWMKGDQQELHLSNIFLSKDQRVNPAAFSHFYLIMAKPMQPWLMFITILTISQFSSISYSLWYRWQDNQTQAQHSLWPWKGHRTSARTQLEGQKEKWHRPRCLFLLYTQWLWSPWRKRQLSMIIEISDSWCFYCAEQYNTWQVHGFNIIATVTPCSVTGPMWFVSNDPSMYKGGNLSPGQSVGQWSTKYVVVIFSPNGNDTS